MYKRSNTGDIDHETRELKKRQKTFEACSCACLTNAKECKAVFTSIRSISCSKRGSQMSMSCLLTMVRHSWKNTLSNRSYVRPSLVGKPMLPAANRECMVILPVLKVHN